MVAAAAEAPPAWPARRTRRSPRSHHTRGLTIPGEVKNYAPVTDAMLRNPDPNDWLMIRHDYHANNYSTLNQITPVNVKDLRLKWVWAMNERHQSGRAPGPQRDHVHQQSRQHRAGAQRREPAS